MSHPATRRRKKREQTLLREKNVSLEKDVGAYHEYYHAREEYDTLTNIEPGNPPPSDEAVGNALDRIAKARAIIEEIHHEHSHAT